jgi:hypothetical protein
MRSECLQAERDFMASFASCRTRNECEAEFSTYRHHPLRSGVVAPVLGLAIAHGAFSRVVRRTFAHHHAPHR